MLHIQFTSLAVHDFSSLAPGILPKSSVASDKVLILVLFRNSQGHRDLR